MKQVLKEQDNKEKLSPIMDKSISAKEITEREYNLLTNEDTIKAFRRGGGKEHAIRCYTCRGYNIVKLTSTSPSGETRIIREFKFK